MKLSDWLAAHGSTLFAQIALVLAFVMFLAVVIWVTRRPKREIRRHARIPLEDENQE